MHLIDFREKKKVLREVSDISLLTDPVPLIGPLTYSSSLMF